MGLGMHVHAHGAESTWHSLAAQGIFELPTKFCLMPFQGEALLDVPQLLALLHGKLNRWGSLGLPLASLHSAVECELQIWALHGYPLGVMLKIWLRGRYCPPALPTEAIPGTGAVASPKLLHPALQLRHLQRNRSVAEFAVELWLQKSPPARRAEQLQAQGKQDSMQGQRQDD